MFVHMISGGVPRGRAIVIGGGAGDGDGGFVDPPVVTTTSTGDTTIKGQVKPGSFGKFVFPLATIQAGRQYTFRYTPDFSRLSQQGKLAMVGFGLKNSNDFHIVGLRGDGTTGLHKYKVYGTPPNGWNKDSGHTTSDGGAAAAGTQAGPNYIRLTTSVDGTTYLFETSSNGAAWNVEYSGSTPDPFTNVSGVTTFGIALWFNNADAGPFSIVIDQFVDALPVQYLSTQTDNTNTNIYTFSNLDVGTADANRKVFACVGVNNTGITVSSVIIGGVAAVKIIEANTSNRSGAIFVADVPTGATATVVVTASGTSNECLLSLYRTTIASLGLLDTASNVVGTGSVNTLTLADLAVRPGGVALVFAGTTGTAGTTEAYNGADPLVVDDERNSEGNRYSSCSVRTTENVDTNDFTFTTALNQAFWLSGVSYFPLTGSAYAPNLASTFSDGTDGSIYTFNAQGIGVANVNRQILICFGWASGSGRTVTSVTVDGNAATAVAFSGSGTGGCAIYRYAVAAGTTGNIVINMSGTCVRLGGGVYDTRPRGTLTAVDTGTDNTTTTSITGADVEVRNGGFLIVVGVQPATETMSAVYNGADTLVKDSQLSLEATTGVGLFSCLTTEYVKTNDAGFSAATSNVKRVCAASWL
ncbi:hypothetical protein [Mesorhizobium sp. M0058]|uniref:hypothetical protein n=1 Tax=Mesorhizobium sp. M0058 TaxID=2956865 RepID=UPI00333C0FA6